MSDEDRHHCNGGGAGGCTRHEHTLTQGRTAVAEEGVNPTTDRITLAAGDAAWLIVLVQNAVPREPGSPLDWEGKGRENAMSLLKNGSQPGMWERAVVKKQYWEITWYDSADDRKVFDRIDVFPEMEVEFNERFLALYYKEGDEVKVNCHYNLNLIYKLELVTEFESSEQAFTPGGEVDYQEVPDEDLPGMWEAADFTGGQPDTERG